MTTRTDAISGLRLAVAQHQVNICDHPTPLCCTALADRAEVWHCLTCDAWWSELGTRGHHCPWL